MIIEIKPGTYNHGEYCIIKCDICGREYRRSYSTAKNKSNHFCCTACRGKWRKQNFCGDSNPFYGKKHTEETRNKMCENHADCSGSKSPCFGKYKELSNNWKGGTQVDRDGYIRFYNPDFPKDERKRMFEHRYVMEKFIGRRLTKDEVVHHINGIKNDNRIENLILDNFSLHSSKHKDICLENLLLKKEIERLTKELEKYVGASVMVQ